MTHRPTVQRRARPRCDGRAPLAEVAAALPYGLLLLDAAGRAALANPQARQLLALAPGAALEGKTLGELLAGLAPEAEPELVAKLGATEGTASLRLADGRVLELTARPLPRGGRAVTVADATARVRAEAEAAELARRDALTGLASRCRLRERLADRLASARRRGQATAVFCLDLDRFKAVNDALGHAVGDALLRTVGDRLRSAVRESDLVARFGDEFGVLQVGGDQPHAAEALARRLVDLLARSYVVEGHLVNVGVSVGVALAPQDGDEPDHLLRAADLALYRAKTEGKGTFRFFAPEMDARLQERRALENELRRALALRELQLHYQPLFDLAAERITGFEALLRWENPSRGPVSPAVFVPLAEETGLIGPIGEWVLRSACREAASWPESLTVAVNLSPVQFRSGRLVESVQEALTTAGLPSARLELEITEGVLMTENEATLATLRRLRELGARIVMDDFGTGYSSLSYLRSFPFDKIKIDQSFVRELARDADSAAIVRAVASLGRSLGIATTAEGVETLEQARRIRAEGCTQAQGYLISRPVPAERVPDLIASRASRAA